MPFPRKPAQAVETDPRPPIALARVKSEQIATLGYDAASSTMAVQFRPQDGNVAHVYHYPNIMPESFETARKPETTGSQFRALIKGLVFKKYAAEIIPDFTEQ
jgi:hypothetical protein